VSDLAPTKACAIVLRQRDDATELLVFRHPLAGIQIVKGTIERGESSQAAALRELWEEAGIRATRVTADLGTWASPYEAQVWAFHVCEVAGELPDTWTHHTADDGGLDFEFFWHPLPNAPTAAWHPVFAAAWRLLVARLPGPTAPATAAAETR
jgi:8-oxo-dGTP pyrophosphatase MutT (NUDIX family)